VRRGRRGGRKDGKMRGRNREKARNMGYWKRKDTGGGKPRGAHYVSVTASVCLFLACALSRERKTPKSLN